MLLAAGGKGPEKGEEPSGREQHYTQHLSEKRGGKGGDVTGRAPAMKPGALGSRPGFIRDNCMILGNHIPSFTPGLSFPIWQMEL